MNQDRITEASISEEDLVKLSREQIEKGSKSFNFASFFFNEKERHGAWLLYSWCRFCDDEIDRAPNAAAALSAMERLERETRRLLRVEIDSSIQGEQSSLPKESTALSDQTSLSPAGQTAFYGLGLVVKEFGIPTKYPLDLLRGFRMDVESREFETLAELDEYCYCVAGVVGLMMCHITGISESEALHHAVAMGSAMQLTNISRDVDQDWKMGRIYFPRQWLRELLIEPSEFGSPANRQKWPILAKRLLDQAERAYETGEAGLEFLSFRSALAVAIASRVYRQIGVKVRREGAQAWDERRYVPSVLKLGLAAKAGLKLAQRLHPRLWQNWKPQRINEVYSFLR